MIINICHNLFKKSKLQVNINQFYYTIPQNSTILVTVTRKFPVSSYGWKERLKHNFYSLGFYWTPNLSIHQNSTQELTLILVTLMCLILFTALVIFGIRLYLNDLYVSIPDRLLVTCALAQILHDIPVEALIADGNIWEASPYLKVSWTFLD